MDGELLEDTELAEEIEALFAQIAQLTLHLHPGVRDEATKTIESWIVRKQALRPLLLNATTALVKGISDTNPALQVTALQQLKRLIEIWTTTIRLAPSTQQKPQQTPQHRLI